jgi:hypothetical protein
MISSNTSLSNDAGNRIFDEFSPKKMVLQARSGFRYLLSKWKIIIPVAVVVGTAGALYTYTKKTLYVAETTFALDEATTRPATPHVTLLDQLTLGSELDAGTVFSSITNIVELMQSRLLIEKTLRTTIDLNGKKITFADFFLDSLDYRDKWMKKGPYYNINFTATGKDAAAIRFENGLMRNIYEVLTGKYIKISQKGKGTTIIAVSCISEHELFSKYFLEAWLDEVTHYYIETKTQRAKNFLTFIQKRTDSVKTAYFNAVHGRAAFTDAHINPSRQTISATTERQQTDVQLLKTSYVELVSSLEAAKTSLMRETPLIQFMDKPILPLKTMRPSIMKRFIIFALLGGFLLTGLLLIIKIYKRLIA